MTSIKGLYSPIEPYNKGFLKVDDIHTIYYEEVSLTSPSPIPVPIPITIAITIAIAVAISIAISIAIPIPIPISHIVRQP